MTLENPDNLPLVAAAAMMAGDPSAYGQFRDWAGRVRHNTTLLALLMDDIDMNDAGIDHNIEVIRRAHVKNDKISKAFSGTLIGCKLEKHTKRYILTVQGDYSTPDQMRTPPVYTEEGRALVDQIMGGPKNPATGRRPRGSLKGHKVFVYIDMQRTKTQKNVRVLTAIRDLGTPGD